MKCIWIILGLAVSLAFCSDAFAQSPQTTPVVGEQYEIIVSYVTSQEGSDGSSSSSSGQNALLERVVAISDLGLELEFDLSHDATAEDRARVWQYPARVLQLSHGQMRLLNGPELEGRVDRWLAKAGWTREVCGRWIFTWNAFRIECEPESVVADIEAINLRSVDLRDGAAYRHPQTTGSARLKRTTTGQGAATFSVTLEIDADAVRRARAEDDVAVAEIMQKPVTLDAALQKRAEEVITGTVEITFDTDSAGSPIRRTVITTLKTVEFNGVQKTDTRTVTVTRQLLSNRIAR
jgi:hypothetical protein